MYSKEQGMTGMRQPRAAHPSAGHSPAYRQPPRTRIEVPANYRGHAIVDGEERPLGHLQEEERDRPADLFDGPTPHFDGLPRVSELGASSRRPSPRTVTASFEEVPSESPSHEPSGADAAADTAAETAEAPAKTPTPPSAPRPAGLFDLGNFPFGHGVGMEELLILGLIWFLLRENADCPDRGDLDETVILLGLLLLLG